MEVRDGDYVTKKQRLFLATKAATIVAENGDYSMYSRPVWKRLNMFHNGPTEHESNQALSNQYYKWNERDVLNYRFFIPLFKHIKQ